MNAAVNQNFYLNPKRTNSLLRSSIGTITSIYTDSNSEMSRS